jgi:hypothetical protein
MAGGAIARGEGGTVGGSSKGVKGLRARARWRVHHCRAWRLRSPHRLGCVASAAAGIMPRNSVPIFSYSDWLLLPTCRRGVAGSGRGGLRA